MHCNCTISPVKNSLMWLIQQPVALAAATIHTHSIFFLRGGEFHQIEMQKLEKETNKHAGGVVC